jgi:hypothetical protein
MTQTSDRPATSSDADLRDDLRAGLEADLTALRGALAGHPFPTHQDDLLAHLVGRREPVRLAGRVASLSRTRSYASVDEVCDEVRRRATPT